jgi:hypothetical protein
VNHYTSRQAREQVRDAAYLAKVKRAMKADPIGRANVPPEIVTALIDALEDARESNRHNFAVARAALAARGGVSPSGKEQP